MTKLNLFEIEQSYINLAQSIIDNDGIVTDEQIKALQITQNDLETKGKGYGYVILDLESEIEQIEIQEKRLKAFKLSRQKTIDRLKSTLSDAMLLFEITEIKTPTLKLSFRNSESVEIENADLLDAEYLETKTTVTPNKTKIKEAIKNGEFVTGAVIKHNKNLQIK